MKREREREKEGRETKREGVKKTIYYIHSVVLYIKFLAA